MKRAEEIFGVVDWKHYDNVYEYDPMLAEFGEILLQVDDNDYTGDSRVLYQDGTRYGYLQFGWGSCSGCDALQACQSMEEVQKLMDELYASIRWFDTSAEALEFFRTHDWEGDYDWNEEEQKKFVAGAIALLTAR